ncbi:MAG TPA: type IV pili methyl-accepting chemotaxis transducer N-terminal domain-containing protein [Dongiaceae bacterium]|nr:type IV pili methyl-accepting chemotaxis transducer N-terminal domain-containing protein [Dongiaceae bacterium]
MPHKLPFRAVVLFFCCVFSVQVWADVLTLGSAINKAGRQRMLSQNIMKNHLALALDVDVVRARQELDRSVALFEAQFQELEEYAPSQSVRSALAVVDPLWQDYRALALGPASRDSAAQLLDRNNALLKSCHQVVLELQSFAGRESAQMVNISGRQRMLSQRIAAYYFAQALGFHDREYTDAFAAARQEYSTGLHALRAFPHNTPELNQALKKVDSQWALSNTGFDQLDGGRYVPHVIAVTTSGMLRRMDEITGLYENLDTTLSSGAVASAH